MYSEKTTDLNQVNNKLKNQQYHSVRTVPKSNMNIVEKGKIDTLTRKFRPLTFQTWYMHFNKKKMWHGQTSSIITNYCTEYNWPCLETELSFSDVANDFIGRC